MVVEIDYLNLESGESSHLLVNTSKLKDSSSYSIEAPHNEEDFFNERELLGKRLEEDNEEFHWDGRWDVFTLAVGAKEEHPIRVFRTISVFDL